MIHPQLLVGIDEILAAPFEALKDPAWMAALIGETGLWGFGQRPLGSGQLVADGEGGLMQSPLELAQFLVLMSDYPVQTALEIGTFNGWTAALMTAYLNRWNPWLSVTTIDPSPAGLDSERDALSCLLPLTFARLTSRDLCGRHFDLCFIDALHDYHSVKTDYLNVGQFAKICAFHDIKLYRSGWGGKGDGDVPRFWGELRQFSGERTLFREFVDWSPRQPLMGIGARIYL